MTWVPRPETANWEAPAGIAPWRELTDEEFSALEAEYDAQFSPDQAGALREWFEQIDEAKATKKKAAKSAAGVTTDGHE